METRHPNTQCANCTKPIYKRPWEIERYNNVFCSKKCRAEFDYPKEIVICPSCEKSFTKRSKKQVYCSKACSGFATRNRKPEKRKHKNNTELKIATLRGAFEFDSCMIQGCSYNRTYDVHRLVHGKNGGEYVIGNMFAICPNHHAEIHRGLITVEKVNDFTLRTVC